MSKTIGEIEDWVVRLEGLILFCALFGLIAMLAMQVLFRFVLQAPLAFTEEAGRLLFAWLIFVGAARALYVSQHFMVDILYNHVPAPLQKLFGYVSDVASIGLAVILAYAGFKMMSHGGQILPVLGIPAWTQMAALPVGMTLLAFHAMCFVLRGQHVGDGAQPDFEE
ncbi:TRAP-type C4-dicarboxylate transport system, small permease component [Paracoccus alcaliphilus]|uniref:TRAP transporter small permease protein n=1 Tax=Paracoccus alcaliphilus TaxID=34002 RepID=A0A1H8MS95_9RHOB|nr:TRAP transporter small permease [Paracoccus alcaliphilus]WCR19636.1 TRAP transporter small permease [Paracoccus alcaliphilus]SEO20130.1 TRAP-type C4-dicarboxylate transport system, small permease component [Paracoccus alcaliphilus]